MRTSLILLYGREWLPVCAGEQAPLGCSRASIDHEVCIYKTRTSKMEYQLRKIFNDCTTMFNTYVHRGNA